MHLKKLKHNNKLQLTKSHHTALRDISKTFQEAATGQSSPQESSHQFNQPLPRVDNDTLPRVNIIPGSPPRVKWKEPIILESSNPTSSQLIKNTGCSYTRITRANKPTLLYENEEETISKQHKLTNTPTLEKENMPPTPHIIPPDEPQQKQKITLRRSTRIFTTKLPASISQSAVYHFLGNAIQMNKAVIRPINLPKPKQQPITEKTIYL